MTMTRRRCLAAVFSLAAAAAQAGQPSGGLDLSGVGPGLSPSAESGKPMTLPPATPLGQRDATGCAPALPCDLRLLGTVRKNGAVELQVPALRW